VTRSSTAIPLSARLSLALFSVFGFLFAHPASAAEWTFKLSLNLTETYSDNIRLATRGNEQPDWVTQISPGLALNATGPRLKLSALYQMQNQFYAQNFQQDSTRHQLNADARTELLNNRLFLDGTASIGQQNISALGAQAINNFNITANRADVMTLTISPYLQHRFQSVASGELRYGHSVVNTNATGLANNQTDRLLLKLDSGDSFKSLVWGLNYNKQQASYNNYVQAVNSQTYGGNLSYLITPRFALTAGAGYEKSDYLSIGTQPVGSFFSSGFSWAPSERTHIEARLGRRYFGKNYALNARHRSRRTTWNANYSEDITTTQAQFLDSAATPTQPIPGPVNLLNNRIFLQKRLQTSVTLNGRRNVLMLTLFDVLRDAQTPQTQNLALPGAAAQGDRSKQLGGNAFWSSKIGPYTAANLTTGYVKNTFPALGATSHDKHIQLGIAMQLQTRLNGLVEWRHTRRNFSQMIGDYQENAVTASLLMQF